MPVNGSLAAMKPLRWPREAPVLPMKNQRRQQDKRRTAAFDGAHEHARRGRCLIRQDRQNPDVAETPFEGGENTGQGVGTVDLRQHAAGPQQ